MTTQGDPRSISARAEPGGGRDRRHDQDREQDRELGRDRGLGQGLGEGARVGFEPGFAAGLQDGFEPGPDGLDGMHGSDGTDGTHAPDPELEFARELAERHDQGRDPDRGHGRDRRARAARSGPRRVLTWCGVVLAVGGIGWVVTQPNPGDWLPGLGPSSKDAGNKPVVVGNPPATSSADPNPFSQQQYFPAGRVIDQNGYKAKLSGVRQGDDCAQTLQDSAKDVLRDTGCQGFLTVSFSGLDGKVLTSVTILRFADDATGRKVADLLRQQPGAVRFVLPDTTIAAPSPSTGGTGTASAPRVEAVHHYVTVAGARPADGAGPSTPADLESAAWAASYTAGATFMWQ